MRTLELTMRRKWYDLDAAGKKTGDGHYYGNITEEVVAPGKKVGDKDNKWVPAITLKNDMVSETVEELIKNIGGEENLKTFFTDIYTELFKGVARKTLTDGDESTEEKRATLIEKVQKNVAAATFADEFAAAFSKGESVDEMSSPEMLELAVKDIAEYGRRVQAILGRTRGVKL